MRARAGVGALNSVHPPIMPFGVHSLSSINLIGWPPAPAQPNIRTNIGARIVFALGTPTHCSQTAAVRHTQLLRFTSPPRIALFFLLLRTRACVVFHVHLCALCAHKVALGGGGGRIKMHHACSRISAAAASVSSRAKNSI